VRAFVAQPAPRLPAKVFSGGPVFRYERPSKGRYRQFTQTGVELIGASGPLADAEAIALATNALHQLGLRDYRVTVGHVGVLAELLTSLGLSGRLRAQLLESLEAVRRHGLDAVRAQLRELDPELFEDPVAGSGPEALSVATLVDGSTDRPLAEDELRASLNGLLAQMGAERLGRRTETDVVERLLRKLHPGSDRQAIERALEFVERLGQVRGTPPAALSAGRSLLEAFGLSAEPLQDLERTIGYLPDFGADLDHLQVDLGLSRGLQYYTGMVFEIHHGGLGGESQLCGGGRYDDLFRALGGRQSIPASGFAFGVERVRLALESEGRGCPPAASADVYVVAGAPALVGYALRVAQRVRETGRSADLDVTGRPLRASLAYAGREGYRRVAIVGETDALHEAVRLRDMVDGHERSVPLADLSREWDPPLAATRDAGRDPSSGA
jgi:histidyl-tRNA synthetase